MKGPLGCLGMALAMSLLGAGVAQADPSIIVNGVNVTGIRNQSFDNVNVLVDAMGNVIITAPSYVMKNERPVEKPVFATPTSNFQSTDIFGGAPSKPVQTTPAPAVVPQIETLPNTPNPVYLVATFYEPGRLGANIDVYINGQYVKRILQNSTQFSFDVSSYLGVGTNTIQYKLIPTASDYGYSSTATADLNLSKLQEKHGDAVVLAGQYAGVHIRGSEPNKPYTVTFIVPGGK